MRPVSCCSGENFASNVRGAFVNTFMPDNPETTETIDLDFLPTQPAVTAAMRKRVSKAWANAERDRDYPEIEEQESA